MDLKVSYALAMGGLLASSTPFAKLFAGDLSPGLLAVLLYLCRV